MAGKGGYERPATPAASSGPGAASQRTDGNASDNNIAKAAMYVSGEPYGKAAELNGAIAKTPIAGEQPAVPKLNITDMIKQAGLVGFDAPTTRPNEPVTQGNPYGAGLGPKELGLDVATPEQLKDQETKAMLLNLIIQAADRPDSSNDIRQWARQIRGSIA